MELFKRWNTLVHLSSANIHPTYNSVSYLSLNERSHDSVAKIVLWVGRTDGRREIGITRMDVEARIESYGVVEKKPSNLVFFFSIELGFEIRFWIGLGSMGKLGSLEERGQAHMYFGAVSRE